jgi:GT2 family glycosyltransferase
MPRLSIVIVTYNSRPDITGCLDSLTEANAVAIDHEIIVVDNASADGTAAIVRERWPAVTVVDAGANIGFAAANNLGIRRSSGELVLLLNPDTLIPAGEIDELVEALDHLPEVAIIGPRIVAAGRAELSFGRMISPFNEFQQKLLVVGNDRGWPFVPAVVERLTRRTGDVDWVSGACLLIRRADLEAVGLLDERFFLYTEDVDLCASVRARGRRVRFEPSVEIVHLRGRSAAPAGATAAAAYRRSQVAFYEKHYPRWVPALRMYLRLRRKL